MSQVRVGQYVRRRGRFEPKTFKLPRPWARKRGFVPGARVQNIHVPGKIGVIEETGQMYLERISPYGPVDLHFTQRLEARDWLFVRWDGGVLDPITTEDLRLL